MSGEQKSIARRLMIAGRVQGVGYRRAMVEQARALGISGWVRNRGDGQVEALVVGEEAGVIRLLAWTRLGPPRAQVERVSVEIAEGEFDGFEERATL